MDDVARERLDAHAGIDFTSPRGGDIGLGQAAVLAAEEDGAGRFEFSMRSRSATTTLPTPSRARFLRISLPKAPAPMTRNLAAAKPLLIPPTDQSQPGEAVFIGRVMDGEQVRHAMRL